MRKGVLEVGVVLAVEKCNECMKNAEMEEREQQRLNVEHVCKRARV